MDIQDWAKQQIVEAVCRFQKEQLSLTPQSVSVSLLPDHLVVTLRGAACLAERDYARDTQARLLLETLYGKVFDAVRPALESVIGQILERTVRHSKLVVDAESGDGVILFSLSSHRAEARTGAGGDRGSAAFTR